MKIRVIEPIYDRVRSRAGVILNPGEELAVPSGQAAEWIARGAAELAASD